MHAQDTTPMNLAERDRKSVWHPFTPLHNAPLNIPIVKGEGSWLIAEDGTRYLDMVSSWWVNLHGHAHPYIAQKLAEQANKLEHVIFAGFTHPPAVELAEALLAILPTNQNKVFYSDNGSTAVEVAIKIALQYFYNKAAPRKRIVALQHAYHGDTFGAMSVSGRGTFTGPFDAHMFEVDFIDVPVPGKEEEALLQAKNLFGSKDAPAAFIFEPLVQGTAGMVMYSPDILGDMINIARQYGVLCIADEVMTGFGRTGRMFASNYLPDASPDIICLSKGLTGGTMAMGITTLSADIFEAFKGEDKKLTFYHGHSYTANPLSCTAALASLSLLKSEECRKNIEAISNSHLAFIHKIKDHPCVQQARALGTILAIEIRTAGGSSYFSDLRDEMYRFFLDRGILMRPLGNIIYLIPPYSTTHELLSGVYRAIEELLSKFATKERCNG